MRAHAARRPTADEHSDYQGRYVHGVPDGDVVETLIRQADGMRMALAAVTEAQAAARPAPEEWSGKQVLGHITEWERIFCFRALCFARGLPGELPGFDQVALVEAAGFDARSWASLVAEYAAVRAATIMLFDGLHPADWERAGIASGTRVTVRGLAYLAAGHELHHIESLRDVYHLVGGAV
ncbi:MAG: DinB family protein [Anaerolineales bacterium]|nr:DinB family protein [Anaerolineales bacterium]